METEWRCGDFMHLDGLAGALVNGRVSAVHENGRVGCKPDPVSLGRSLVQCRCNFEKRVALGGGFCLFGPNQAFMSVSAELFGGSSHHRHSRLRRERGRVSQPPAPTDRAEADDVTTTRQIGKTD